MKVLDSSGRSNSASNSKVHSTQQVNGGSGADENKMPTPPRPATNSSAWQAKRPKSTHDMLADIFKKIGSKENTKEVSQQN